MHKIFTFANNGSIYLLCVEADYNSFKMCRILLGFGNWTKPILLYHNWTKKYRKRKLRRYCFSETCLLYSLFCKIHEAKQTPWTELIYPKTQHLDIPTAAYYQTSDQTSDGIIKWFLVDWSWNPQLLSYLLLKCWQMQSQACLWLLLYSSGFTFFPTGLITFIPQLEHSRDVFF